MIEPFNEAQQSHIRSMSWLAQVFPQKLRAVIEGELWRGHAKKDGTPFASFYDAATTPIPYGLGLDCPGDHLSYREAIRACEVMRGCRPIADMLRDEAPPERLAAGNVAAAIDAVNEGLLALLSIDHPAAADLERVLGDLRAVSIPTE